MRIHMKYGSTIITVGASTACTGLRDGSEPVDDIGGHEGAAAGVLIAV